MERLNLPEVYILYKLAFKGIKKNKLVGAPNTD
jgi:hypothetical protein